MYEWECMREIYGDIPKPTFIRDDKGEYVKAYQAMPFFKGMTLGKYKLTYGEKASDSELLTIIANMMHQIKNVHDRQMLHRDIRLENFIIDPDTLAVTLIDFGMSSLDVEKERQFCEKYRMIMQPEEDMTRGRWWDLYHFRGAVYDLISDNKKMTVHYRFLGEIFHCLQSPHHSIFPSLNWMILKTEQLRDEVLKNVSLKR
jgi:serine/threonine protein kinase